jgi:hypothetical protein
LETDEVTRFRSAILTGQWVDVETLLSSLPPSDITNIKVCSPSFSASSGK